ncbi:MAG: T9SS type A sorting domain-containing protein [bacterium]
MKTKMILFFALAILIVFAGKTTAQDLVAEKVISLKGLQDIGSFNPGAFAYSNEKNLFAMQGDYDDLFVIDAETKEKLLQVRHLQEFAFFNKGQSLIGKKGSSIKIYNTTTWKLTDSLTYNNQTILDFVLSKDQKKLCVLFRNGLNIYPDMKLVIWDMTTKEIVLEKTINCELDFQVTDKDEFVFLNMDWNENLNYLSFEWSLYTEVSTPFRSGRYFTKIYSLNENKMIKNFNHALDFIFDKYNNNGYYYEESYSSEGKYCLTKNLYKTVNLLTDVKSIFNFEFDLGGMASVQDYLIFSKSPYADEFFIINKENQHTKTLKTSYDHLQFSFTEDKTKLIAQSKTSSRTIAIYDITNITGISVPSKETVLYPNPTSQLLNLEFDKNLDYNVQIIDESGKIIDSFPISNSYQLNYDTSKLPKGMYILQLNSKSSSNSYKFQKE